ncbi:MAG: ArsR family transcriptional regulator [Anaerolineales bacterium]|nr:ArsR family transcriptional regulator [Anaerolineales bacterium]
MKTARQRIVAYLAAKGRATPRQISQALKTSPANIRHHLSILQEEGVVRLAGHALPDGRGRPARAFSLTQQRQEHNLEALASALLDELETQTPETGAEPALRRLARRLATGGGAPPGGNLTQRLITAMGRLNGMHYHAHWEARTPAPRLVLGHCPYAAILDQHPELCRLDAYLLEALLSTPVTQTARLELDRQGVPYCAFSLAVR